jgi:hypothetical protein
MYVFETKCEAGTRLHPRIGDDSQQTRDAITNGDLTGSGCIDSEPAELDSYDVHDPPQSYNIVDLVTDLFSQAESVYWIPHYGGDWYEVRIFTFELPDESVQFPIGCDADITDWTFANNTYESVHKLLDEDSAYTKQNAYYEFRHHTLAHDGYFKVPR